MKNVTIVAVKSVNSEYEMYNLEFAQENEGQNASLSRRLKGIFANRRPKRVFQNFSVDFIKEIEQELAKEGRPVDIIALADVDLSEDEFIEMPASLNARIVTTEFLVGEEIPEYLKGGAFVHQDAISDTGKYQVRDWVDKNGDPQTKQPKLIVDEETGDTTYFKKDGKNIYMERFIWIDGDPEEARVDKFIQHDKGNAISNSTEEVVSKLSENLKARKRATTN